MWSERLRWWLIDRQRAMARSRAQDEEAQRRAAMLRRLQAAAQQQGDCYEMRSVAELLER